MSKQHVAAALLGVGALVAAHQAQAQSPNQVTGTWRMVSARIDPEGRNVPAYGARPNGMLVFTPDMHFVELMSDADVPRFAANVRGQGTAADNKAAMAGSIGLFGSYTVDGAGAFTGDVVEGSTFPNWVGDVRTSRELRLVVASDCMDESFRRPDGTRIVIRWKRVR